LASSALICLGVVIDGTTKDLDLQRLLPKMRGDGLITSEKTTWFITDKGKAANTDRTNAGPCLSFSVTLLRAYFLLSCAGN
jgi:hypothetical protein